MRDIVTFEEAVKFAKKNGWLLAGKTVEKHEGAGRCYSYITPAGNVLHFVEAEDGTLRLG